MSAFTRQLQRRQTKHSKVACQECGHQVTAHRLWRSFNRKDEIVVLCKACFPKVANAYIDRQLKLDREKEAEKQKRKAEQEGGRVILPWHKRAMAAAPWRKTKAPS